jgi:choline dehydrogenase-like flavoprotein
MSLSGFACLATLLTPESRGNGRVPPDDPPAAPLVDPAYLTDEADAPRLMAGIRRALDLGSTPSMRDFLGAFASIMPDIVRGNTHATAVMIGERAADLIG